MDAGMAGGIAGAVIGVMGGVIGTAVSIMNAKGPRERALILLFSALCWLWLAALAAWMFLAPNPWKQAALVFNLPILLSIPAMNRKLAAARVRDEPLG